jgi:hypothetical protein
MAAAADWVGDAAQHHADGRWLLFVDEFDPHEPFDTPEPWQGMYEDAPWDGERMIWPPYVVGGVSGGHLSEAEARHLRANYGAKLTMIDHWFGRIARAVRRHGLWADTAVIVCTDHGHYLGEERTTGQGNRVDIWGKPMVPQFEPLGHIPLMIHWPGVEGGGVRRAHHQRRPARHDRGRVRRVTVAPHARPLARAAAAGARRPTVRDWAIGGVFGNWVQVTDGAGSTHARPKVRTSRSACGATAGARCRCTCRVCASCPSPTQRAFLDRMPGSTVPVIRQPFQPGDALPFWVHRANVGQHHLYDVDVDPDERENRVGERVEAEMQDLLRTALADVEAPVEHLDRLGLSR